MKSRWGEGAAHGPDQQEVSVFGAVRQMSGELGPVEKDGGAGGLTHWDDTPIQPATHNTGTTHE